MASALFGIAPADSGEIIVNGKPVLIRNVQDAVGHGIAYVPEDRLVQGLVMSYSIKDNIVLATLDQYKNSFGLMDEPKMAQTAGNWIQMLKIKTDTMHKTARTLSGGNQQKTVLAKWLAMGPKVLILDGPTVGVDIGAKAGLFQTINKMAREEDMAVILISDEIREITANCHRVLVLRNGRINRTLDTSEEIDDSYIQQLLDDQKKIL